jgi:O-antigen/teichoic acid export membrane protein
VSRRILNLLVNYAGVGSSLIISVVFVPLYVRYLGPESYGLIAFSGTLLGLAQVVDLGLGATMNREMARRSALTDGAADTADLARTIETICWGIAMLLGLVIALPSQTIASRWLGGSSSIGSNLARDVALIGLVVLAQWPGLLYGNGLLGLQRQGRSSAISAIGNGLFGCGAVVVLRWWPTVTVFFLWRAATSLLTTIALRHAFWRAVWRQISPLKGRFAPRTLLGIWRFALGAAAISSTATILIQVDKVIVSRTLSLAAFGTYMIAATAAGVVSQLVGPIFSAILPPLTQSVARDDWASLRRQFHFSCQLMSTLIAPVGLSVAAFAEPLLITWTRDPTISRAAAPVLCLLALGATLNSMVVPFYGVLLGTGRTRISTATNCALLAVVVPYGYFAARTWGAVGAASTCLVLNFAYVLLSVAFTMGRVLNGEVGSWLRRDVGLPIGISGLLILSVRHMVGAYSSALATLAIVSATVLAGMVVSLLVSPALSHDTRKQLRRHFP